MVVDNVMSSKYTWVFLVITLDVLASSPSSSSLSSSSSSQSSLSTVLSSHDEAVDTMKRSADALCLPGFQCVHGVCTSGTTCQCDQGWTGPICTVPVTAPMLPSTTLPPPRDSSSGKIGEEIEEGNTRGIATREECIPGFRCVHGVCSKGGTIGCDCDQGWTGAFCHLPDASDNGSNSSPPSHAGTTSPPPTENTTIRGQHIPLDGYGPLADIRLRYCTRGFECRYGNCSPDLSFSCICEPGFDGLFCQDPCTLDCGPHGKCKLPSRCECNPFYSGVNCSELRTLDDDQNDLDSGSYLLAVVVSVSVVLVLVILLLLAPYLLWRRGNIAMLKLVFWVQNVENDDGRLYDAFVSYASTEEDRQFVMECLIPILEDQMEFTLCIHERDFMPGKFITSNILESVRQSRRTLLVISPAFVSRNWCQFEFQMAVAEMIEKKQRILPVLLGDLKDIKQESTMHDTLQRVLNTVTYLQYPGHGASEEKLQVFWKRLELSMPKKTANQSITDTGSPVQTPTSITPLSTSLPSHQHTPCVIFPSTPHDKSSHTDQINSDMSTQQHQAQSNHEPNSLKQTGHSNNSFGWLGDMFTKRKRKWSEPSIYAKKYSFNHTTYPDVPIGVRSNNEPGDSATSCYGDGVNNRDKLHYDNDGFKGKQPQIELSGWTWPTPDITQHPVE